MNSKRKYYSESLKKHHFMMFKLCRILVIILVISILFLTGCLDYFISDLFENEIKLKEYKDYVAKILPFIILPAFFISVCVLASHEDEFYEE